MNTVYCWFDWDDNTTSVNSINIIKEPRKPLVEYERGERVLAKLPQFGLWHGVIVETSQSKTDLLQKLTARQKNAAAALVSNDDVQEEDTDNETDLMQKNTTGQKETTEKENDNTDDTNRNEKSRGKKKEKGTCKKRTSEECTSRSEEKKKKKMEEAVKQDARNKQLEEIILKRRKHEEKNEDKNEDKNEEITKETIDKTTNLIPEDSGIKTCLPFHSGIDNDVEQNSFRGLTHDPPNLPYWQGNQFSSPYSAFQNYSYFGDLMSQSPSVTSNATFHSLASQKELQERCIRLETENEQLKQENEQLKEKLGRLSQDNHTEDVVVTPKKVDFLRQLVSSFEKKTQHAKSEPVTKQKVYKPTPVRLTYAVENPSELHMDPCSPPSGSQAMESDPCGEEVQVLHGRSHWEECVTISGVKKVRLHQDYEVYLTQGQLSQIRHAGSNNPRKMTIALLDVMFSREHLAKSSAKGTRKAHNGSLATTPLPTVAIQAIKQFVLNTFKNESGVACLSEAVFNDIINSKCATARRSLKS